MRLTIERMSYGADAIAHDEAGKTVFVRGGTPGDVVEAELMEQDSRFVRASLASVVEAGPQRVEPRCPLASVCGGCPWAQLSRAAQLDAKRDAVVDSLVRIAHFDPAHADGLVDACRRVGDDWGYRNKVELGFAREGGRARVGMHAAGSNQLVRVDRCPLLDARDTKLVKAVSGATTYLANARNLDPVRISIRSSSRTGDLELALWTAAGPFPRGQAAKILADATGGKATSIVRVLTKGPAKSRRVIGVERLLGKGSWTERMAQGHLRLSAPSFFQVNTAGAEMLVSLVLERLSPAAEETAMDLYCGVGTFTLPLARHTAWVAAVEAYAPAVRDLRRNVEDARLDNIEAIGGDAGREFPDLDADIVVVDPPRAGLSADVVAQLSGLSSRAIAYVSCDPATLARDLARFRELGSFRVERIVPVDLFPQTYHVETVTLLLHA